jgi:iron-sulfur cluster insertion protein
MSDTVTDSMVDGVTLTDNAAKKVRNLRDSEGNNDLMLRVYVTGGGCSGFSYGFNFEPQYANHAAYQALLSPWVLAQ